MLLLLVDLRVRARAQASQHYSFFSIVFIVAAIFFLNTLNIVEIVEN